MTRITISSDGIVFDSEGFDFGGSKTLAAIQTLFENNYPQAFVDETKTLTREVDDMYVQYMRDNRLENMIVRNVQRTTFESPKALVDGLIDYVTEDIRKGESTRPKNILRTLINLGLDLDGAGISGDDEESRIVSSSDHFDEDSDDEFVPAWKKARMADDEKSADEFVPAWKKARMADDEKSAEEAWSERADGDDAPVGFSAVFSGGFTGGHDRLSPREVFVSIFDGSFAQSTDDDDSEKDERDDDRNEFVPAWKRARMASDEDAVTQEKSDSNESDVEKSRKGAENAWVDLATSILGRILN